MECWLTQALNKIRAEKEADLILRNFIQEATEIVAFTEGSIKVRPSFKEPI